MMKLFLSPTEEGRAPRGCAPDVPGQTNGCIDLPKEELTQLKYLLDKTPTKTRRART